MAKLPKKTTMVDTISRVQGYIYKLHTNGNISLKMMNDSLDILSKLKKVIINK